MTDGPFDYKNHPYVTLILLSLGAVFFIVLVQAAFQYMMSTHCYEEYQFSDGTIDSCEYILTSSGIARQISGCKSGLEYRGVTNYKVLRNYCESDWTCDT